MSKKATKADRLSPEGEGLLRALVNLRRVRTFDAVGAELLSAGFAAVEAGALVITQEGDQAARLRQG